jgi:hypothetical protein
VIDAVLADGEAGQQKVLLVPTWTVTPSGTESEIERNSRSILSFSVDPKVFALHSASASSCESLKYLQAYASRARVFSFVGRVQIVHSVSEKRKHSATKHR